MSIVNIKTIANVWVNVLNERDIRMTSCFLKRYEARFILAPHMRNSHDVNSPEDSFCQGKLSKINRSLTFYLSEITSTFSVIAMI